MKYEMKQNGGELTVVVEGRLDTASAPELDRALRPLLRDTEDLIFDFSNLDYVSSAGLRVISFAHLNKRRGGSTRAIHCNSVVKEVFKVTGFTEFMTVE